jgi:2-oxoglutarate dehydrogenase E2 component (dihydrolipoamide succinyltransferase)
MSESVLLPALGESVTEGTVTRWLKKVGDTVAVDEPLVEVSTDKVDTEIPSPFAGVLEQILVQEDETVAVGAALAIIGSSGSASAAVAQAVEPEPVAEPVAAPYVAPAAPVAPAPVAPAVVVPPVAAPAAVAPPVATPAATPAYVAPSMGPTSSSDANYVTPLVRKFANDNGIDLTSVSGTGVGGRIRKEDVIAATAPAPAPTQGYSSGTAAPVAAQHSPAAASPLRGTTEPMSRLRKVLAERAVASMISTAQLTTVVEVDVTSIASMRQQVQPAFVAKTGGKLNFMPFFLLAAAEALKAHPKLNASVDGENIVYHPSENISFAVDTEKGLLTPVIRDASTLNLAQIAMQISDLAARTRNNQLKPDELGGGTFTLTNTGSRGALFDTPVVFLPQVAILGTGIVTKRPAVVKTADGSESIAIRSMVYLALSYDHRVVDGADASRFLVDVKTRLEEANFTADLGL